MKVCAIVGAGPLTGRIPARGVGDLVIAADGGASALQSREANDKDNFDMSVRFMNSLTGDARFTLYNLLYSTSASNKSYWNHPRADELMMQGRAIVDVQASHDLYTELYGIIRDEMPSLPLYFDEILVGLSANVEGFIPRGDGIHVFGSDVVCYK